MLSSCALSRARACSTICLKDNPLAEERVRLREELRASDPLDNRGSGDDNGGVGLGWLEGEESDDAGQGDY